MRCSDAAPGRPRLITLEGMPGGGKTTLLAALAAAGRTVIGEYTTDLGATSAIRDYPHVDDEDGHLANWLRKDAQGAATGHAEVWMDRDWLTALAWGAAAGCLPARAAWAARGLDAGLLHLPHRWVVLDVPVPVSFARRAERLDPAHPWADPVVLRRLRDFYRGPAGWLRPCHPGLAERVAATRYALIDATAQPTHVFHTATGEAVHA